jgi:hypothetical protein
MTFILRRNVLSCASSCVCVVKAASSMSSGSISLPISSVSPSAASAYILLARSICIPPSPVPQPADQPPPALWHALAAMVMRCARGEILGLLMMVMVAVLVLVMMTCFSQVLLDDELVRARSLQLLEVTSCDDEE